MRGISCNDQSAGVPGERMGLIVKETAFQWKKIKYPFTTKNQKIRGTSKGNLRFFLGEKKHNKNCQLHTKNGKYGVMQYFGLTVSLFWRI